MPRKRWKVEELAEFVDPGVLGRAQGYVRSGRVTRILDESGELVADVQGSAHEPYRVRIVRPDSAQPDPSCDCPYGGAWCKHAAAAILVWGSPGEAVRTRAPLASILETMTKATLVKVIEEMGRQDPAFDEAIRFRVTPVDAVAESGPEAFEDQVRRLVHSLDDLRRSEAYWQVGKLVDRVLELVDRVAESEREGDLEVAATALEGITRAWMEEWTQLDDSDGRCTEPHAAAGELWTRILLRMHRDGLAVPKRWIDDLNAWGAAMAEYDVVELAAAAEAARHGWDSPMLEEDWEPEARPDDDELVDGWGSYFQEMVRNRFVDLVAEFEAEFGEAETPTA